MESKLNDLQEALLKMMAWLHDYCIANNLRYYALGGTMLGAIRHKGFIPWDDDIDIGMPRKDYNTLVSALGNKKVEHYYLETPESNAKDYKYPYSKLYDLNTTLIERTWPKLKRGIFIDIFPLDGFGNTEMESIERWNRTLKQSNFMWARICSVRRKRSFIKNMAIVIAHAIPNCLAKDKQRLASMNSEAQRYDFDKMDFVGNTFGNWGIKELMESSIMGEPKLYPFEKIEIFGVENPEQYLTHLYGNWRELPPVEKRVSDHAFSELDLLRGYIE